MADDQLQADATSSSTPGEVADVGSLFFDNNCAFEILLEAMFVRPMQLHDPEIRVALGSLLQV